LWKHEASREGDEFSLLLGVATSEPMLVAMSSPWPRSIFRSHLHFLLDFLYDTFSFFNLKMVYLQIEEAESILQNNMLQEDPLSQGDQRSEIRWSNLSSAKPYSLGGRICPLCLVEKTAIARDNSGDIQTVQFGNQSAHSQHLNHLMSMQWTFRQVLFSHLSRISSHLTLSHLPPLLIAMEQHDLPGLSTAVDEEYRQITVMDPGLQRRSKRRHTCLDVLIVVIKKSMRLLFSKNQEL
jgi:hypothetical protein